MNGGSVLLEYSIKELFQKGKGHIDLQNIWVKCQDCKHYRPEYHPAPDILLTNTCGLTGAWRDPEALRHCVDFPFIFNEKMELIKNANKKTTNREK